MVPLSGRLETAEDPDWYAFTAEAGHIYRIRASEGPDLEMRLYDQDGTTMLDSVNPNSSSSQTLTIYYEAPSDGTYYIGINQDYGPTTYYGANIGDYTVTVSDFGVDDAGESRTQSVPATTDGVTVEYSIEMPLDEDWIAFEVVGGNNYPFEIKELNVDLEVRLRDEEGNHSRRTISSSSNSNETLTFDYFFTYSGTHYLQISPVYDDDICDFEVTISDLGSLEAPFCCEDEDLGSSTGLVAGKYFRSGR